MLHILGRVVILHVFAVIGELLHKSLMVSLSIPSTPSEWCNPSEIKASLSKKKQCECPKHLSLHLLDLRQF